MVFYTVYKTTNKINNKYYIGKHQTNNLDDDYMGSGKLLSRAIKKYGLDNFYKEILYIFDNEQDMNDKEKELVVIGENSYNLNVGGYGGFSYIHKNGLHLHPWSEESRQKSSETHKKNPYWKNKNLPLETRKKISLTLQGNIPWNTGKRGYSTSFKGKHHSEETKQKMLKPKSNTSNMNMGKHLIGKPAWNKGLKGVQVAWNKGIPCAAETKEKISQSKRKGVQ